MSYSIVSAAYANADGTAIVVVTREAGAIAISPVDTPELWAATLAAVAPAAYVPPAPAPRITYKADIWRRATEAEAATLEAALAATTPRLRNLYRDASVLDHSDPLFTSLLSDFTGLFGASRAQELLAPSL